MTIGQLLKKYGEQLYAIELFDYETGDTLPLLLYPKKIINKLKFKSFQVWYNENESINVLMIGIDAKYYHDFWVNIINNGLGG
ncbi:hypothetical protein ELUMI_v1c05100 [Williamsoniiplasma luminosum]|uniref:Uncharacterized protein n=1 Tax=Williamsoniiplasma luminosum TaxID=214888 RepID=A0A2K8NTZ1_9MOLU|nr:hypothetical protein [Williamsoniiplasma luminosum]ATZ17234.1 hypothetical protein ELUMI_v1c05100 [Williamsoniiplasma luminosum]